jgi:hypothetical protein
MVRKIAPAVLAMVVTTVLVASAQVGDVKQILADARAALGGDKKLDAVKTLALSGQSLRTSPGGTTVGGDVEMALELPDKFMRRDMVANMGNMSIYRMSGFNGDGVINEMDQPPQLSGGGGGQVVMFRMAGPGGTVTGPGAPPLTPEQQELMRKAMLTSAKQDFARLTLGMLATSFPAFPLTMTYAGQAESPDGKADIIDVKGEGDFAVRLFIDAKTHLPLMLSWMAREPMTLTRQVSGPGGGQSVVAGGGAAQAVPGKMTPEEREKLTAQMAAQAKEADAKRRVVEYRLFYADYRSVDGVMLPFRLERSVDGKPTEEITFDKVKVNAKIDAKTFAVSK